LAALTAGLTKSLSGRDESVTEIAQFALGDLIKWIPDQRIAWKFSADYFKF